MTRPPVQLDIALSRDGDPVTVLAFYLPPDIDAKDKVAVYDYFIQHLQYLRAQEHTVIQ
jgi:hypothetical protein